MKPQKVEGRRNHITAVAILLAIAPFASPSAPQAQTLRSHIAPISRNGSTEYVGHYGEVFKLLGDWQIAPALNRGIEVVNHYPMYDPRVPDYMLKRFTPLPADFTAENFSRLGLIQLMIIPRALDAFRSLEELRKEKVADLSRSGIHFTLRDHPSFPAYRGDWPQGTFEVEIQSPYRLTQFYTASSSFTLILTAGVDPAGSDVIYRHSDTLRYALANWIVPQAPPAPDESPAAIVTKGIAFYPFGVPAIWMTWAGVMMCGLIFIGLGRKSHWNLPQRLGISAILFTNAGALFGGALGLLFWPFAWFTHHFPILGALTSLCAPFLAFLMTRLRKRPASLRAYVWTTLSAAAATGLLFYASTYDWGLGAGADRTRYLPALGAILGFATSGICGIIFASFDSTGNMSLGDAALVFILTISSSKAAHAQPALVTTAEAEKAIAVARLENSGVTPTSFEGVAFENLREKGEAYAYQRVEILGIFSPQTADNSTNARLGPIFDLQIAPTHIKESRAGAELPAWLKTINGTADRLMDLNSLNQDARNQISSAADEAVK